MARSFGKRGHDIISGANEERLAAAQTELGQMFGHPVEAFAQDLSQPGRSKALYQQVAQMGYTIEVLVNNAGMGLSAPTEEIDCKADEALMRLNMMALVDLCKLYLPEMYRRGS